MKYFKTPHLPNSPGIGSATRDDKILSSIDHFIGKKLVTTIKMDGSNVCLSRDFLHARSENGPPSHKSFSPLKAVYGAMKNSLDKDLVYYGEWLYAKHSIHYKNLNSYLQIFNIYSISKEEWLSFDDLEKECLKLQFIAVPLMYEEFVENEGDFNDLIKSSLDWLSSVDEDDSEGIVVRVSDSFKDPEVSIAKWVRKNHVQTDDHWLHQEIKKQNI